MPPLAITQCTSSFVLGPLRALEDFGGQSGAVRTVGLRGLERFWVAQKEDNLCWAAALETIRGFLNLQHISHEEIPVIVSNVCPKLRYQKGGASIYQIELTEKKLNEYYDKKMMPLGACNDEKCIVHMLERGRPLMVLKNNHAVLIQSVDIAVGTTDMIRRYRILDPAGDGRVEVRSSIDICSADAILAF